MHASAAISDFSAIACPTARRASTSSFSRPRRNCRDAQFLLGGAGWGDKAKTANIRYFDHVYTRDHNAFNCTPRAVLNVSRESMARYGFSPATRVFEAAGAGACLITDAWEGIELFLEPDREVLVAHDGDEVAGHCCASLTPERARAIGQRGRRRVLAEHTYAHRAAQVEARNRRQARGGGGQPMSDIVILGLSITSSWGNGHATTYRSLVRGLAARGHRVLFLERDQPWYAGNRDEPHPAGATTVLYDSVDELIAKSRAGRARRRAGDRRVLRAGRGARSRNGSTSVARGRTAFYDIDTPVTSAKLAAGEHEYITPDLIPRFDMYLSFTGGPTLRFIESRYGARMARVLYCSVDTELYRPAARPCRWDLGYLGTYSDDRQPVLE